VPLCAKVFHIERVRRLSAAASGLNVAEVAKGSGAEWKLMTEEQRRPYMDRALAKRQEREDEEREKNGKKDRESERDGEKEREGDEEQHSDGRRHNSKKVKAERAAEQWQQDDGESCQVAPAAAAVPHMRAATTEAAAGQAGDGGGDEDDGELSPALSLRRASVATDGGSGSPRRPASAAQLFINEHINALQQQARRGGGKAPPKCDLSKVSKQAQHSGSSGTLLCTAAQPASPCLCVMQPARQAWDALSPAQKQVSASHLIVESTLLPSLRLKLPPLLCSTLSALLTAQLWHEYHDSLLSAWCEQKQRQRERDEVEARRRQAAAAAHARATVDNVASSFNQTAASSLQAQHHHNA
jgi:hypothetical protein